ncbi:MAG: CPBP family intramembrane metalloprotease [Muribaculaceae bacterium]|nr:CPBP family intramembrane metalloprotease [Muribaculaceae bacterium]
MNQQGGLRDIGMVQLLVLFCSLFVGLIIAGGVATLFMGDTGETEIYGLFTVSAVQNIIAFCLPAWMTARYVTPMPEKWLHLTTPPTFRALIGVLIVYIIATPAMNWLIDWNQNIHLPESMKSIEDTLRTLEETNGGVAEKMLGGEGILNLILSVSIVGILTGFSEELFFRGSLQHVMFNCIRSKGAAIWITAFIFSALHFQFFGFVPRLIMGVFFGYLLIWTESLWIPIAAHILNNSVVAVTYSSVAGTDAMKNIENFGVVECGMMPWLAIGSVIATTIFLWQFRKLIFAPAKPSKNKYKLR